MPSPYHGGQFPGQKLFAVDGDHTIPQPCGAMRITFPFEGDSHAPQRPRARLVSASNPTAYKYELFDPLGYETNACGDAFIIEQDFTVAADWFSPLPMNTPYDTFAYAPNYQGDLILGLAILVGESPTQDVGGGLLRWTRTYATVPEARNTYETFTFTFPGIAPTEIGTVGEDVSDLSGFNSTILGFGGEQFTTDVMCRVEHQYFLLDNPGSFSPDPYDITSPWYIEPKFSVFYGAFVNEVGQCFDNDWNKIISFISVDGSPILAPPAQNTIPPIVTGNGLNDPDSGVGYNDIIGKEICVRASQIRPWRGNIYEKITLWALAQ